MQQFSTANLEELIAFVAIGESGSFAAASTRLGKDATVLSQRLTSLEARLGVRLAQRTTRKLVLTEAGTLYLTRIKPLIAELSAADMEVSALADSEPRGHLRISLPGSFGKQWIGPLLIEFLKRHPGITADVESTNRYVDLIGERYDLAIRLGELSDSRLIARKISDRRRLLCASPSYLAKAGPLRTLEDLTNHACLVPTARVDPYKWVFKRNEGGTQAIQVQALLASNEAELLVDACVAGMGILYTSDWYVARELADGRLVEVLGEWQLNDPGGVYVLTPALKGMPSKTRAFSDWLARHLLPPPWST